MRKMTRYRQAGIASFFAVAALGLVATAVLAMTTMLRIDHRRTHSATVDAQLRQLLLAGATAAEQQLEASSTSADAGQLSLPPELGAAGATAYWQPTAHDVSPAVSGQTQITVVADYGEASAYQRLRFVADPAAGGYRLVAAEIHP